MVDIILETVGVIVLCGFGAVFLFCGLWAIVHIVADSIFYILIVNDKIKRFKEKR